jgi:hypothetical protein
VRETEFGLVVPQARFIDGTPIPLHVPNAQHVGSTIWTLLGEKAVNEPRWLPPCAT